MNLDQLTDLFPKLQFNRAKEMFPYLDAAMTEFEINTLLRQAAFLAQVGHESNQFVWMEELDSGKRYEGRADLGNTQPGDGPRYKGRGPIQLTGREGYRLAGKALGVPLEDDPTRATDPDVCFRIAGWFWKSHGLNELADQQDMERITRRINGGMNGFNSRMAYYEKAIKILGGEPSQSE